jgi:NADP-dependent 3-hydroxy acid dehydrogenase YdfG
MRAARLLAQSGASVVLGARRTDRLDKLVARSRLLATKFS